LLWWVWLLFLPVPGLLAIWVSFQIGMILLALGCMLPCTITRVAARSVLKRALADAEFYNLAVESGILQITERE
jgi:hypothetical protein